MRVHFEVPALARWAQRGDKLMTPLMRLVSGTFHESPRQTHFWNNKKLTKAEVKGLDGSMNVYCLGVSGVMPHYWPFSRIPIFGGWRDYVVLEPRNPQKWHVGWICEDGTTGISRIPLQGKVRLLIGPQGTDFFGVSAEFPYQIPLHKVGIGRIGSGGPYSHLPLL